MIQVVQKHERTGGGWRRKVQDSQSRKIQVQILATCCCMSLASDVTSDFSTGHEIIRPVVMGIT